MNTFGVTPPANARGTEKEEGGGKYPFVEHKAHFATTPPEGVFVKNFGRQRMCRSKEHSQVRLPTTYVDSEKQYHEFTKKQ